MQLAQLVRNRTDDEFGIEQISGNSVNSIGIWELAQICQSYKEKGYSVIGLDNYGEGGSNRGNVDVQKEYQLTEKHETDGAIIRETLSSVTGLNEAEWVREYNFDTRPIFNIFGGISRDTVGQLTLKELCPVLPLYNIESDIVDDEWQPKNKGEKRIDLGNVVDTLAQNHRVRILSNTCLDRNGRDLRIDVYEDGMFYPITVLIPGLKVGVVIYSRANKNLSRDLLRRWNREIAEGDFPEELRNIMCTDIRVIPLRVSEVV